jgi:hypothetical protein
MMANFTQVSGYNETDLSLTVKRLGSNSILQVSFPLTPLGNLDPEFNSSLYLPIPQVTGELRQVKQIDIRLVVFSTSGLILYSQSKVATVASNSLDWTSAFVEEKNLSKQSLYMASITLAVLIGGSVSSFFSRKVGERIPYLTLGLSTLMLLVYALVGTGDDFVYRIGVGPASRFILFLLNPLFHISYWHVTGNVFGGFLIGGFLVETWLKGKLGWISYGWLLLGYGLTLAFATYQVILAPYRSVGASLWVIALAIITFEYIRTGLLKLERKNFLMIMLAGFILFSTTYDYIWSFGAYYYSNTQKAIDFLHLLFAAIAWFVVTQIISNAKRLSHAWANLVSRFGR